VRTAWPATRLAHSFLEFRAYPLDVLPSGFRFLDGDNPADPFHCSEEKANMIDCRGKLGCGHSQPEGEARMRKFVAGIVLGAVVVFLANVALGQMSATTEMNIAKIMQGQNVSVKLTLNQASNFPASVGVNILPDGQTVGGLTLTCGLDQGQSTCEPSARIPLNAKAGKWNISEITFQPVSGEQKVLSKHGDLSFEVVPHGNIVLPGSATISEIK
jgi:hypothetical protein